jgi:hypothetical protein
MPPTQIPMEGASGPVWNELDESGGGSASLTQTSYEKKYIVLGCADEAAISASITAQLAAGYNILAVNGDLFGIKDAKFDPQGDGTIWLVTLTYENKIGYFELSTGGSMGTLKILQALDQGEYYQCGLDSDPEPDFGGLIGVDGESVKGVEVPEPKKEFTVLVRLNMTTLSSDWLEQVEDLRGYCNEAPVSLTFNGQTFLYGTEELLFVDVVTKQNSQMEVELSMKFAVERTKVIPPIANSVALNSSVENPDGNITKVGWRYLWVYSKNVIVNGLRIPQPMWIIINQVIRKTDLTPLGIFN